MLACNRSCKLFFVSLIAAACWLVCHTPTAGQNSKSKQTKPNNKTTDVTIEIEHAVFGSGRGAASCEKQIRRIIQNRNATTVISTPGLGLRNPRGVARKELRITYRVKDKRGFVKGVLVLKNGQRVNIFQAILKDTANKKFQKLPTEFTIKLPGKFTQVRTGANGRILIFHIRDQGLLAIVDLVQQKILKQIKVPDNVAFAANRTKLLIAFPRIRQLQRWDLKSLQRDKAVILDRNKLPTNALMGANGDGPLLLWHDGRVELWDVEQMKPMTFDIPLLHGKKDSGFKMTVSADGQTFCSWYTRVSSDPFYVMRVEGQSVSIHTSKSKLADDHGVSPNADGVPLWSYGGAAYAKDLNPIPVRKVLSASFVPTEDPRYVLKLQAVRDRHVQATVCSAVDLNPIHKIGLFQNVNIRARILDRFQIDGESKLRYLPNHHLVAYFPASRDRVMIRKFNLKRSLDQSDKKYLYVNSKPKTSATLGETFTYQMSSLASSKRVRYSLDNGPQGMKVSANGKVSWPIKSYPKDGIASVIIQAKGSDGEAHVHAFEIFVSKPKGNVADTKSSNKPKVKVAKRVDESELNRQIVSLPGKPHMMRTGGSGRYIVFHIREKGILAVLDVVQRKIVKEIKVPENVAFAANRKKLLIAFPSLKQLQRWDLSTLKHEKTATLDRDCQPEFAVMGSDGDGPLAIWSQREMQLWDVQELKRLKFKQPLFKNRSRYGFYMSVSADGNTFCGWVTSSYNETFQLIRLNNQRFVSYTQTKMYRSNGSWAVPTADGSLLLRNGRGVNNYDLSPRSVTHLNAQIIATEDPRFVLAVRRIEEKQLQVTICSAADLKPIYVFENFDSVFQPSARSFDWGLGGDWGLRYLPKHNLAVCIADDGRRVMIRNFNLKKALDRSGEKYLHFISKPKPVAHVNDTFSYQMAALSSSKQVTYSLASGPKEMKVSSNGKLTWKIDSFPKGGVVDVVVNAKSNDRQSASHAFQIFVKSNRRFLMTGVHGNPRLDEVVIQLPAKFKTMRTGGGGRYLIFHIHDQGILVIMDVVQRKIVKEIEVPNDIAFAANRKKLLIAFPQLKQLQRWDLSTFKRDKTVVLDRNLTPEFALMGSNSDGPLAFWGNGKMQLWDVQKMKQLEFDQPLFKYSGNYGFGLTVSADGQAFCGWIKSHGYEPFQLLRLKNNQRVSYTKTKRFQDRGGWAVPIADGSMLLQKGGGVHSYDLRPSSATHLGGAQLVPTEDPRFVLAVRRLGKTDLQITICSTTNLQPIYQLENFESVFHPTNTSFEWGLGGEPGFRYLPNQNVAVCIADDRRRVFIRNIDLKKALDKAGNKYLHIISKPHPVAKVDDIYSYQMEAITSAKRVTYSLASGPKGMKVNSQGKLTWKINSFPTGGVVQVVVNAKSNDGQSTAHAFEIVIEQPPTKPQPKPQPKPQTKPHSKPQTKTPVAKSSKKQPSIGEKSKLRFVKIDNSNLQLPGPIDSITRGLDGRLLLLVGDRLAIIEANGVALKETSILVTKFVKIRERKKYFVAISNEPKAIFLIDKQSFKITKSRTLSFEKLTDLVLHPTLPMSYVTGKSGKDAPRYRFIAFDEAKWEGYEDNQWIGNWLAIDPHGEFIVTGFSDYLPRKTQLSLNKDKWKIVPRPGILDWLVRYKIDKKGIPEFSEVKTAAGEKGNGIRMSSDGKRITFLSGTGTPRRSKNLASWQCDNFKKTPVSYETGLRATSTELAYHGTLPLVASPGKESVTFFDRETGKLLPNRLAGNLKSLAGHKIRRILFSSDGKNLIFATTVNDINYLKKMPLKLTPAELRAIKAGLKGDSKK